MATKKKAPTPAESRAEREIAELEARLQGYKDGNQTPYTELKQTQLTAKIERLRAAQKDSKSSGAGTAAGTTGPTGS